MRSALKTLKSSSSTLPRMTRRRTRTRLPSMKKRWSRNLNWCPPRSKLTLMTKKCKSKLPSLKSSLIRLRMDLASSRRRTASPRRPRSTAFLRRRTACLKLLCLLLRLRPRKSLKRKFQLSPKKHLSKSEPLTSREHTILTASNTLLMIRSTL